MDGQIARNGVFPCQRQRAADDLDIAAVLQRRVLGASRVHVVPDRGRLGVLDDNIRLIAVLGRIRAVDLIEIDRYVVFEINALAIVAGGYLVGVDTLPLGQQWRSYQGALRLHAGS